MTPTVAPTVDETFIKEHQHGWKHGISIPKTVFSYDYVDSADVKSRISNHYEQQIVQALVVLDEAQSNTLKNTTRPTKNNLHTSDDSVLIRKQTTDNVFSPYFTVPRMAFNEPTEERRFIKSRENHKGVPKLCFQNHYDETDTTYTFGGLQLTPNFDWSHLGIPNDVDPSRVSVHFPVDPPPFLSNELLSNPLLTPNRNLLSFNPLRGSLTYIDTLYLDDDPVDINAFISCRISKKHLFFYGGFKLITNKVYYNAQADRWIVEKSIEMNRDGFLLDKLTFKFRRIALKPKGDICITRLGATITSSVFEERERQMPTRIPSPPVFQEKLPSIDSSSKLSDDSASSLSNSPSREPPKSSLQFPKAINTATTLLSRQSPSRSGSSTPISRSSGTQSSMKEKRPPFNNSPAQVSKTSKMSNVLSKSSRIFHRHHSKDSKQQQQQNQQQSSSSSSTSNQSFTPHTASSNYSKHVGHNRSMDNSLKMVSSSPLKPKALQPKLDKVEKVERVEKVEKVEKFERVPSAKSEVRFSENVKLEKLEIKTDFRNDEEVNPPRLSESSRLNSDQSPASSIRSPHSPVSDNHSTSASTGLDSNSESVSQSTAEDILFNDTIIESGINGVTMFVFGGFCEHTENGHTYFRASDDLLRINLSCKEVFSGMVFSDSAIVTSMKNSLIEKCSEEWPSPRGYFASTLVDHSLFPANCFLHTTSDEGRSNPNPVKKKSNFGCSGFFRGKALLVQGGCNSDGDYFSDLYLFVFDSGCWKSLETYCYDYFNINKDPDTDEDGAQLSADKVLETPEIVTAELRSCHHTVLYYKSYDQDYLIFLGGFRNDYLRHFDKVPYKSSRFDVSRLSKPSLITNNTNLFRIPILNLKTQTWRFMRYYYDIEHALTDQFINRVTDDPKWVNSTLANFAGCISLNGKIVTVCHGLAYSVPEKKEDFHEMQEEMGCLMWGAHVHYNFPSM